MTKLEDVIAFIQDRAEEPDLKQIRNVVTRVLYGRHKQVSKVVTVKVSPEAQQIAEALATSIRANYKFIKAKPIDIQQWAVDIDMINRIDKYPFNVIAGVAVWSQQDDFWKQNVRSGKALRRHFEKMLVKIQSSNKHKATVEI